MTTNQMTEDMDDVDTNAEDSSSVRKTHNRKSRRSSRSRNQSHNESFEEGEDESETSATSKRHHRKYTSDRDPEENGTNVKKRRVTDN